MAWATASDITDRYGSDFYIWIADRDKDGAVAGADLTAVNRALDTATSKAAHYIASKYDLEGDDGSPPTGIVGLSAIPAAVQDAVVDLAVYDLAGYDASALTDEHRQRHKEALAFLLDIAKGYASLGVANPPGHTGVTVQLDTTTRRLASRQTEGLL